MQELSISETLNINGGASLIISTYYGLIKIIKWITNFVSSRF